MIKEKIPALSFMLGIIELNNLLGSESLYNWLTKIGERIAELEGKGIEGKKIDDVHYLPTCPFVSVFHYSSFYEQLPKSGDAYVDLEELKMKKEQKADGAALANIFCIMHHAYRKKRAELAGKKVFHLAAKSHLTDKPVFNEKAIERCGKSREEIEKILEIGVCVFKYEPE